MEIRIGIQNSPREISFETSENAADLQKTIAAAIGSADAAGKNTLTLTDVKGSTYLIPANAIAYVELGTDSSRRVGFVS